MKIAGIIPARYASTRFPGKPLADIAGLSMIRRVYEQCLKSKSLDYLVVATDDQRIHNHVSEFGGNVLQTSPSHSSGTDRCNEIAQQIPDFDVYINIQGDEPLVDPQQIDLLANCFSDRDVQLASLFKKITSEAELFNENTPKVVLDSAGYAIYFSRHPIPFNRSAPRNEWLRNSTYLKHIGLYGYRADALRIITSLEISSLERTESLEQLRWLENGFKIKMVETESDSHAVDTPEDLEKILKLI